MRKVLLLEPRMNLRTILRGVLHSSFNNVEIYTPNTAMEAVKLLLSHNVDLLVASEESKPIIGEYLIKLIRKSNSATTRRTPTMIITNTHDITEIKNFLASGCDEILRIPFSYDAVYARIHRVWNKRANFLEYKSYVGPDRRRTEMFGLTADRRRKDRKPEPAKFEKQLALLVKDYLTDLTEKKAAMQQALEASPNKVLLSQTPKLFNSKEDKKSSYDGIEKKFEDLEPGMMLAMNVITNTGMMVLDTQRPLSEKSLTRLQDLINMRRLEDSFYVYEATSASSDEEDDAPD